MVRPFRAQSSLWTGTQGVALGARNAPLVLNTTAHPYCTDPMKGPSMRRALHLLVWLLLGGSLVGLPPAVADALPPQLEALGRLSVMLGRPTDRSITLNLLAREPLTVTVEYGAVPGPDPTPMAPVNLQGGVPAEVRLTGLKPDTAYVYRLRSRPPGTTAFTAGPECGFHTQRAPGSTFSFEIQGDSHPERPQQFDGALYTQTLRAAAADRPDFYLTSGDDFSVDKTPRTTADPTYTLYNREAYRSGAALPNSGRVRVTVSPAKLSLDYLRSWLPKDATAEHPDGEVAFHYEIPAPAGQPAPGTDATPPAADRKAP